MSSLKVITRLFAYHYRVWIIGSDSPFLSNSLLRKLKTTLTPRHHASLENGRMGSPDE